jgi:hypothetical protein
VCLVRGKKKKERILPECGVAEENLLTDKNGTVIALKLSRVNLLSPFS